MCAVETVVRAIDAHDCSLKHVVEQSGFVLPSLAAFVLVFETVLLATVRVTCTCLGIFAVGQEFLVEWRADSEG